MAVTLTEKFRADVGGKAWRVYQAAFDGSTSTVYAASMDLEYIEAAICGPMYLTTEPANLSDFIKHTYMSIAIQDQNQRLEWQVPSDKTGAKVTVLVVGW